MPIGIDDRGRLEIAAGTDEAVDGPVRGGWNAPAALPDGLWLPVQHRLNPTASRECATLCVWLRGMNAATRRAAPSRSGSSQKPRNQRYIASSYSNTSTRQWGLSSRFWKPSFRSHRLSLTGS